MPIHSLYPDLVNGRWFVVLCERLDPLSVVVSDRDALGQLEHTVQTVLRVVPHIALDVARVRLQPEVTNVQEAARAQDSADFTDKIALTFVSGDARENRKQQHDIDGGGRKVE